MSLTTPSTFVPSAVSGAHDAAALAARRKAFRALHERGCFVIPNPWDVGSAWWSPTFGLDVRDVAALGVRRISVGGALALAAWTGFIRAARTLKSEGSFAGLADLVPYAEINGLFATNRPG